MREDSTDEGGATEGLALPSSDRSSEMDLESTLPVSEESSNSYLWADGLSSDEREIIPLSFALCEIEMNYDYSKDWMEELEGSKNQ